MILASERFLFFCIHNKTLMIFFHRREDFVLVEIEAVIICIVVY